MTKKKNKIKWRGGKEKSKKRMKKRKEIRKGKKKE
jgi:hypothetical protein